MQPGEGGKQGEGLFEREHGGSIGGGGGRVGVGFDEQGVDAGDDGGFGEERGAFGASAGGAGLGSGLLGGVGDIEADGWAELDHVAESDEVVDESVVAKEGSAFGKHDAGGVGIGEFLNDVGHLVGREELTFFDVDGFVGLGGGDEEVGLPGEEGGDLEQVDAFGGVGGVLGKVDIGGGGDVEGSADVGDEVEPGVEAGSSGGGDGGAVGFVVGGFEDVLQAELGAAIAELGADGEAKFAGFGDAGSADDEQGLALADG